VRQYLDVVAGLLVVYGLLQALICIPLLLMCLAYAGGGIVIMIAAAGNGKPDDMLGGLFVTAFGMFMTLFVGLFAVLCAACIASGFGILRRKSWSRIAGMICCALACTQCFPFGIMLGVFGIVVLAGEDSTAEFEVARDDMPEF
jgi:hypothetical protein